MNIKAHTGLLVGLLTVTGFLLGTGLVVGYQKVNDEANQLGPNAAAIKDSQRLQTLLGQWLLSIDLVLSNGETYMSKASERQSREVVDLIEGLRQASLASGSHERLDAMEAAVPAIQKLVNEAAELSGEDRDQRLLDLVKRSDELSTPVVRDVEGLESQMLTKSKYLEEDLAAKRSLLGVLVWVAAAFYLFLVGFAGIWTVRTMVRPIEALSSAAERARADDTAFVLEERGPQEVRLLTKNITTFVTELKHEKEIVEEEVRIRTAQLIKANHAKSEFLANMSHELRTPLNGVINMNELLLDTSLNQQQREYARVATSAANALLGLINDILDFSKIEAEMLVLEDVDFDVRETVEAVIEILSTAAEADGLELNCVIQHDVPLLVSGDALRVRQVLMNLVNNALKFTEHGGIGVGVSRIEDSDGGELIRFAVKDSGIGIAKDRLDSLFEAFVQADATTTRRFGGTGLGLTICRQLAELMGGEIGVESIEGDGSTFWFTIRANTSMRTDDASVSWIEPGQKALVLSKRAGIRDQVREHLMCIGLAEENIFVQQHVPFLMGGVPRRFFEDSERLVAICDPRGQESDMPDILQELRTPHPGQSKAMRVCEVRHMVARPWPEKLPDLPGIDALTEPIRYQKLREWILASDEVESDGSATEQVTQPEKAPVTKLTGRVLIAEDNLINQRVAVTILERVGLEVVTAENGKLALDYVAENPCDLILMDCQMPVMDGWTSTGKIRELESAGKKPHGSPDRVPIIAVTANALQGDREKCLEAGMDDYVTKPVKAALLIEAITRYLG